METTPQPTVKPPSQIWTITCAYQILTKGVIKDNPATKTTMDYKPGELLDFSSDTRHDGHDIKTKNRNKNHDFKALISFERKVDAEKYARSVFGTPGICPYFSNEAKFEEATESMLDGGGTLFESCSVKGGKDGFTRLVARVESVPLWAYTSSGD